MRWLALRSWSFPIALFGLLLLVLPASSAHAQPRQDPGRRHEGFYLRLMPSLVGLGGTLSDDTGNTGFGGGGFALDVAVGGNVVPNVILFGELVGLVAGLGLNYDDPIRGKRDTAATSGGIGFGVLGYLRPSHVYLTGSIGVAGIDFFTNEDDLDERIRSKAGFYLKFAVGKEWWVSRRWALGIGGVITYRRFSLEEDGFWVRGDGNVDFVTIGPAFTASFD